MEYIVVRYPKHRQVIIDGELSGFTNIILMIQNGHHQIELDGKADYSPSKSIVMVKNTDVDFPMKIEFIPLEETEEESDA